MIEDILEHLSLRVKRIPSPYRLPTFVKYSFMLNDIGCTESSKVVFVKCLIDEMVIAVTRFILQYLERFFSFHMSGKGYSPHK